jgi:hypothetical protein
VVGAGLPIRTDRRRADTRLVVIGAHGGAGESRIAALHPTWHQAGHLFPDAADGPASVLLCCRTQVSGLLAAQAAAAQWAAGSVPWLRLLGLVITPDTPGRPPKAVRELARVIVGGVPRSWTLPWFEPWRLGEDPPTEHLPQPFRRLVLELDQLVGDDSCTQPRSGETSILEGSSDAQP